MIENIGKILMDQNHTYELILAIDNKKIRNSDLDLLGTFRHKLRSINVFNTRKTPPKKFDMDSRRTRIADLRTMSKYHVGGSNFVFSFEDDTTLPFNALPRLLKSYSEIDGRIGFVQGVEVGRWGHEYIGAWKVDDINNPTKFQSMPYGEGVEEIDAGGFYCYLTPTDNYKAINYTWVEPMGPDVDFGLQLAKMGCKNYIDWSVICGHMTKDKTLYPENPVVVKRELVNGRWRDSVI